MSVRRPGFERRGFLRLMAAAPPVVSLPKPTIIPRYRIVSRHAPAAHPGIPGPYPGRVVSMHANHCVDETSDQENPEIVRNMLAAGLRHLTGERQARDAWARFFNAADVVGIKVNCVGRPKMVSTPCLVGEIAHQLVGVGVKPTNIYVYERFQAHLDDVPYGQHLPAGVQLYGAEIRRTSLRRYDPATYVDVNFFGEEDTRSYLIRLLSERITKIVNVPIMKDHMAAGVTGCLKNLAYGSFSNVDRSHRESRTHTRSFIATLASVEPLRSRAVLQVMDGIRGVWHGGPFVRDPRFVFHPKRLLVGTDPVAIDRLLIDIIEEKRKAEGAISLWDRSPERIKPLEHSDPQRGPYFREPGHVEYASELGLGTADRAKIQVTDLEI